MMNEPVQSTVPKRRWHTVTKVLLLLLILTVLGLVVIPLISGHGHPPDAREAEAMAGTLKTALRAKYVETKKVPQRNEVWVLDKLDGFENSRISHAKYRPVSDDKGEISVYLWNQHKGWLTYEFSYESGVGIFEWHSHNFE